VTHERQLRLFFALWPHDHLRRRISQAARASVHAAGGRPVPRENLHITLAFLGNVAESRLGQLKSLAAEIHAESFQVVLGRLGFFGRARSLWLGPTGPCPELSSLQHGLSQALGGAGWRLETRRFTPHMTLARNARDVTDRHEFRPLPWRVENFSLIQSVTDQRGAVYTELAHWPLSGG
jgi:2'-5' RNA ligase